MNARFRIATLATLALFFLALVFGARLAVRSFSASFDGWERFARSPKTPVVEPGSEFSDAIQEFDWPDPPAVAAEDPAQPDALRVLATASKESPGLVAALLVNTGYTELQPIRIAVDVKFYFGLAREHDIDSLAASLKLSDSQKARLSNLIEWRKTMLDALAGIEGSEESAKAVIESFRTALEAELDPAQAQAYQKMKEPGAGIDLLRSLASEALNQAKTRTSPLVIQELLKAQAEE